MEAVIRSIETHYAGHRFRSRLEARFVVFFDALGVQWEYEPEGFELPSGQYLPDFQLHLPQPVWFEVKPAQGARHDRRWAELVEATGRHLVATLGTIRDADELYLGVGMEVYCPTAPNRHDALAEALNTAEGLDWSDTAPGTTVSSIADAYASIDHATSPGFTYCDGCETVAIHCSCARQGRCPVTDEPCGSYMHPRILAAYRAARSARFEFGESG